MSIFQHITHLCHNCMYVDMLCVLCVLTFSSLATISYMVISLTFPYWTIKSMSSSSAAAATPPISVANSFAALAFSSSVDLPLVLEASVVVAADVVVVSLELLLPSTSGCDHASDIVEFVILVACKSTTGAGILSVPVIR